MNYSYKKRLYRNCLSISAAVLVAFLAQTAVVADSIDAAQPQIQETIIEKSQVEVVAVDSNAVLPQKETNKVSEISDRNSSTTDQKETSEAVTSSGEESSLAVANEENLTEKSSIKDVKLAESKVYMSEKGSVKESIDGQAQQAGKITWTLDNKPLSEWLTWNMEDGTFSNQAFLTVTEETNGEKLDLTFDFNELFGTDLSLRSPYNIRRTYRGFIGEYELLGISQDLALTIRKTLVLRPYEDFQSHDEMLASIEKSKRDAKTDRLVDIETLGKSAQGRDIKLGIVASDQSSIDTYLNVTNKLALTKPEELLKLLNEGKLDYKLPVLVHNTHADEQPGIDVVTGLFRTFATEASINFKTTDEAGNEKNVTLDVPTLLKKFIFLFDFTENPDGDVLNLRALANGLDPNRDASYQANPEVRTVIQMINKWNPIALYDIHGFVKEFLIEPATPPHDPNFEYDLLSDIMLENAHYMGRAGVANSKYDSYIIPKLDWGSGWDDSFSGYTGVYAVYHGILGHTIEIPESNEESYKAGRNAVLGGIDYLAQNPDKLMERRLQFYQRGIKKVESAEAENELIGPNGEVVGRIKNGRKKFFPDYYVISMSLDKDNDSQEAFNMIDYFKRNGVVVQELKEDTGIYKKGDLVIDMAQAKRGYANHILYKGSNESDWSAMYAELVVNFPDMRGFKTIPVFDEGVFNNKLGEVTTLRATRTNQIDYKAPYYVIANNSKSAVQAVNHAIRNNEKVYLTDDGYIVDTATFAKLLKDYAIYGDALYKVPQGETLKALKVYAPPHHYSWAGVDSPANTALALEQLGFEIVSSVEEADVIVLESNTFDSSIVGVKPTIVVGGSAMQRLEKLGILEGFDAERFSGGSSYEGLMKALIDEKDPLTSGYKKDDFFYSNSGNWIANYPTNFKALATIAGGDFYVAGWWPGYKDLANKVVAIAGSYKEQPMFVYAGNPTNRLHTIHFYRWISNAIFGSQLASLTDFIPIPDEDTITKPNPSPSPSQDGNSLVFKKEKEDPGVSGEVKMDQTVKVHSLSISGNDSQENAKSDHDNKGETATELPKTGSVEHKATYLISSILLLVSGNLFLLKKKDSQ
ncbi:hypothetical protein STRDD10_00071 [Streptococcus sp. DD10]|nr:LPXTG-anchored zinc carboxypeptidase [Streptococcus sp. DD10]KXT77158.1 hypothetical protein STRDD10_00071 [Streptococcus sp. DD10]